MTKAVSPEKRLEWKEKILRQKESGLSIAKWCLQNQVVLQSFYYWKAQIFPKSALGRESFTELVDEKETGIFIEYQKVRIYLDKNFDSSILKRCLLALKEISC
jgi:predicted AAA+ superfamily ATPase